MAHCKNIKWIEWMGIPNSMSNLTTNAKMEINRKIHQCETRLESS